MAKKETSSIGKTFKRFKRKGKATKKWSNRKESRNYHKSYRGQGRG